MFHWDAEILYVQCHGYNPHMDDDLENDSLTYWKLLEAL